MTIILVITLKLRRFSFQLAVFALRSFEIKCEYYIKFIHIFLTVLIPALELLGCGQTNLECASTTFKNTATTTVTSNKVFVIDL